MYKKLLTISIASYNTEKFVEETVNSLLVDDAHLNKMEIILVNDGSTDRTSELAHKLAAEHPGSVLVIDKENGGYGSTINASLSAAKGKYYKLLDGDDWYNTRELPGFLDYLEKCEADLVVTPFYEVRGSDKLVDTHPEIPGDAVMIETQPIAEKNFAMHELAIKTDVLRSYDMQIAEHCFYTDTEYVFYCFSAAETIARYGRPIYRYRLGVDGQSVSLQGTRKHYRDFPNVAKRIISAYTAEEASCAGSKKATLCFVVQHIVYHTFFAFMLLEEPERHRQELIAFDREIKSKYPEAYRVGNGSRLVRAARLLHYNCYTLLCRYAMWKYGREQQG